MSGKLKLLPHKSWNVWNRDNREKVLKDKRLLQEENDIKSKRDKELEQEHILTVLKSTASNTATNTATNTTTNTATDTSNNTTCNVLVNTTNDNDKQLESFRLFDDIEEKLQKQKQNEDYKKEKEMKELLKQRREGTAPWGLGDGSHEKSKMKPWYINNDVKVSSSSSNEKDIDDKSRLDPMARFIIRDRYEYEYHQRHHDNSNNDKTKSSIPILSNINTIMGLNNSSGSNDNSNTKEKKKHKKKRDRSHNDDDDKDDDIDRHKHKKEKKHKKHKHKHD